VDTALYDISLVAIDVNAANAARSSSAALASRLSSSIASSARPSSAVSSASSLSTALVGRGLQVRQSRAGNLNITSGHNSQEPLTFTVTLPPGRYYFAGWLNTSPRTAANSNIFDVVGSSDLSCLSSGSSTSTAAGTSTTGTVQTGSASEEAKSSSMSGGGIAGIVIGVLGGLAFLGALAFFCLRKRRRQNRGGLQENRFSNLPSASSQDGGEYGQAQSLGHSDPHGTAPIAGAWRRNSDPDEKFTEDPPYANRTNRSDSETPSLGDRRRQAGPPTSHTLTEKKSTQGFIGKGSNESSAVHSRSSSIGGDAGVRMPGGGEVKQVGRSTSVKRKPVPSLGPELRGELERERKMSAGVGANVPEPKRKSYSLVPDLPQQSRA
jgi:hypothetical protein